ncbi:MAG: PEP-CTERM sorting domain-containing protein [Phycisphaerae bacterium]
MRRLLVVVTLLAVSTALAENVYEDPMDVAPGGWGSDVTVITEGDRTFTRAYNFWSDPPGPWFYVNKWAGGEVDISQAIRFECDIRFHQEGSNPYANAWLGIRLGTPDVENWGEYFQDPLIVIGVEPPDSVGDEWIHVGFDLTLADPWMDRVHFDGFEFFGSYDNDAPTVDYVDIDSVVFTPEPNALLLLGLGLTAVLRRR